MVRTRVVIGLLLIASLASALFVQGLRQEPAGDEVHFLKSSQAFRGGFDLEALRHYPEVVTPLALVIWGELSHLTGDGLFYGRLLNLVLTFLMLCCIVLSAPEQWPRAAFATLGLVLFPYTLPLGVHLYTDAIGVFLVVAGTLMLSRNRPVSASLAFTFAIATRQYLVQIPAALLAVEGIHFLRRETVRWQDVFACAAACLTVFGWVGFFGGVAPQEGIEFWAPLYATPMLRPTEFILFQGLYALTGIGAYFVIVEALLFRRFPVPLPMRNRRGVLLAIVLAALFWLDPPALDVGVHPGGPIGRVAVALLPPPGFDDVRVAVYYALALLCVPRFAVRLDIGF
jgi:hypothetical protein